jgi:hypothetical protein
MIRFYSSIDFTIWTVGSLVFAEDLGCKVLELPEDLGWRVLELAEDLFFLDGRESIEQYSYIVRQHELISNTV